MQPVGIGIIGTGNISDAYLKAAPKFPVLKIVACADINMEAAQAKAATYGIEALHGRCSCSLTRVSRSSST